MSSVGVNELKTGKVLRLIQIHADCLSNGERLSKKSVQYPQL